MDRSDPQHSADLSAAESNATVAAYQPPRIASLGTLAALTQGGMDVPDDGAGGAGGEGSI